MNNTFAFNHFNFNVKDLDRSLKFYKEAFGLEPVEVNDRPNFTLAFLGDNTTSFRLELTYLKDRTEAYDLGEQEFHLALRTPNSRRSGRQGRIPRRPARMRPARRARGSCRSSLQDL